MKKVKSSLSSSRLQYPLLMLLLLVMEGVSTVLTVMERSEDSLWHQKSTKVARWQLEEAMGCLEVTLGHSQSLHAYNCPLLIQK